MSDKDEIVFRDGMPIVCGRTPWLPPSIVSIDARGPWILKVENPSLLDTVGRGLRFLKNLQKVDLSASALTTIGDCAFFNCKALKRVKLPLTLRTIGNKAFQGNKSLKELDFSVCSSMESIGDRAICNCLKLKHVAFPASLHTIGRNAFLRCTSLERLDLSHCIALTTIKDQTFLECDSLGQIGLPPSIRTLGKEAFADTDIGYLSIPDHIERIEDQAFLDCNNLRQIVFPDRIGDLQLGGTVFAGCKELTSVKLPSDMTVIPEETFVDCTSLKQIDLPTSLQMIGPEAFANTNLSFINIPDNTTFIGNDAFAGCAVLERVSFPSSLETIDDNAFHQTGLSIVHLPRSMHRIGHYAFECCLVLKSITFPRSCMEFGDRVLSGCEALSSVHLPNDLSAIPIGTFERCVSLKRIEIPQSVEKIGYMSFSHCCSLEKIILPDSIFSVSFRAFKSCTNLRFVQLPRNADLILSTSSFEGCTSLVQIKRSQTLADRKWDRVIRSINIFLAPFGAPLERPEILYYEESSDEASEWDHSLESIHASLDHGEHLDELSEGHSLNHQIESISASLGHGEDLDVSSSLDISTASSASSDLHESPQWNHNFGFALIDKNSGMRTFPDNLSQKLWPSLLSRWLADQPITDKDKTSDDTDVQPSRSTKASVVYNLIHKNVNLLPSIQRRRRNNQCHDKRIDKRRKDQKYGVPNDFSV